MQKADGLGAWSLEKDWCGLTFHHQNMSHLHDQLSSRQLDKNDCYITHSAVQRTTKGLMLLTKKLLQNDRPTSAFHLFKYFNNNTT